MAGKPWYNNGENEIQIDVNKGETILATVDEIGGSINNE